MRKQGAESTEKAPKNKKNTLFNVICAVVIALFVLIAAYAVVDKLNPRDAGTADTEVQTELDTDADIDADADVDSDTDVDAGADADDSAEENADDSADEEAE